MLSKAIGIHILNFTSIPEAKKYHNVFHLHEKEHGLHYFKDMELHTIELNKFDENLPKKLSDFVTKLKTSLDIWSSFLTRNNLLNRDALPPKINKPELKKTLDVLAHINFTQAERDAYEDRLKWLRIETNTLKKQFNDGKIEGQTQKSIEITKKMLKRGTPIKDIADMVGLSATEIKQLAK